MSDKSAGVKTLVVSAWGPEIAPLRRLVRRGVKDAALVLLPVGIGPVEAAIGATAALAAHRPARVIFVGTAGVYPRGRQTAALGSVAIAEELLLVSTAALRRRRLPARAAAVARRRDQDVAAPPCARPHPSRSGRARGLPRRDHAFRGARTPDRPEHRRRSSKTWRRSPWRAPPAPRRSPSRLCSAWPTASVPRGTRNGELIIGGVPCRLRGHRALVGAMNRKGAREFPLKSS